MHKKNRTEEKTNELEAQISTINKEITNLSVEIITKDQFFFNFKDQVQPVAINEEIFVDVFVKNFKKCSFTPPKMKVLWLHIEKDHQYEFQCFYCNHRYKLKHCPEMHKREVHYKGTLVCFVCNEKVRSNKELKQHIQKRRKLSAP